MGIEFVEGDDIELVYEDSVSAAGQTVTTISESGTVTAVPSRKFDWPLDEFDFDYAVESELAVRSVDLTAEVVAQLVQTHGSGREWKEWDLVEITRV